MENRKIYIGDCLEILPTLPDGSVDCCITSPPYYALRDYGTGKWIGGDPNCPHKRLSHFSEKSTTGQSRKDLVGVIGGIYKQVCPLCGAIREDKQIGLEETPEEYIEKLTSVFREVRRVLKEDGTLWINIGDTYWQNGDEEKYKNKDLIGVPWLLAFSLRNDGWYLRQDIIWHKPNPMPESVKDRCTKSHEYIFLFSKSPRYYFDYLAIQEEAVSKDDKRNGKGRIAYEEKRSDSGYNEGFAIVSDTRNKRDVWTVSTQSIKDTHFATFPEKLIEPCLLAGCRPGGIVLDPFFGSGTTGRVAERLGRDYIGIELNPDYVEISKKRTNNIQRQLDL